MRTPLLCSLALLVGAEGALAQGWPAANGYYPPNGMGYQTTPVTDSYGHAWYGASAGMGPQYPSYAPNQFPYFPASASSAEIAPTAPAAPPAADNKAPAPAPAQDGAPPTDAACPAPEVEAPAPPPAPPQPPAPYVEHFYGSASYLALFIRPERITTPLLTTGSTSDPHPGALGQPGTSILFGDHIDFHELSGVQAEVGLYLNPEHTLSLNWSGFSVAPAHDRYAIQSDAAGNPLITRPVLNVLTGTEVAFFDAFPTVASGGAVISARSEMMGTSIDAIYHTATVSQMHVDLLFGFRYLRLAENLNILDNLTTLGPGVITFGGTPVPTGAMITDFDYFETANDFYGGEVGFQVGRDSGRVFWNVFAKAAIGGTSQFVRINGGSTLTTAAGSTTLPGGILALPSNMGDHNRTVLGYIPEGGLQIGFRLTSHVDLLAGYSFLYWDRVVRPGIEIDRGINTRQVPTDLAFGTPGGPARPAFNFSTEPFWSHFATAGVAVHF